MNGRVVAAVGVGAAVIWALSRKSGGQQSTAPATPGSSAAPAQPCPICPPEKQCPAAPECQVCPPEKQCPACDFSQYKTLEQYEGYGRAEYARGQTEKVCQICPPIPPAVKCPATSLAPPAGVNLEAGFKDVLPEAGKPLAEAILRVSREQNVSPFVLAALAEVATGYGTQLKPPGFAGKFADGRSGPWALDNLRSPLAVPLRLVVGKPAPWSDPYISATEAAKLLNSLQGRFATSAGTKPIRITVKPGEYVESRGVPAGDYFDPRALKPTDALVAAIAAFDIGYDNVLKSIAASKGPDIVTRTGNFASSVIAAALRMQDKIK